AEGTPLRAELRRYDAWGRLAETSIQAYEKGKPQAPQWTQRLAYRDQRFPDGSMALGQQPVRIEQPSVIAGKTRATEIDYNDKGQVLRITERGWSPIDAEGKEVPTAIERSTRYAYTTIAGKSLLTEIDGPLPNGPKGSPEDSDITRVEWDAKGLMPLRMRHPAGLSTEWAYLSDGRLERLKDMDGLLSRYSYAPDGGLSAIDRAGVVQRFSRDLQQGIYTSLAPNGQRLSFQFDPSGQLRAVWDGANHRIEMQRDGDGHLAQARLLNPDGSVSQTRSWASDAAGTQGAAGRDTMVDSLEGLIRNADQVRNLARPDPWQGLLPADRLQELVAQARFSDAATGPRRAQDTLGRDTLNWLDDFGQLRRVDSPTTGTSRYAYDAAGRLLSRTDQLGNTARYERDAIGRVLRVQARNAQGQLEEDAQIAWGPHNKPSRIRSLHSDESFAYDAGGRLTRHEQTVDGHRWTLAYAHDANGQLVGKTLPDGRQLDYRYRGSQHPQAGLLESIWLKGWMDRPLVYGMNEAGEGYAQRQFHFGNGLSNERLLDAQGRVSRAGTPELGQTQLRYDGDASEPSTVETRRTTRLGEAATAGTAPPWAARLHAQMARWRSLPSDPAPQPSWVQAVGDRDFEAYDALGRQLSRGDLRLRYDSLNRLVEVSKAQGDGTQQPVANYRYNLFGQRTAKAVSQAGSQTARTTYFFHDGSQLVAEADATGSVQRQYVWVNDKPVALLEQGQVLHIHTDHRNAPVALSDAAKRVVWQAEVEAFLAAGPLGSGPLGALSFNLRGSNQYFDAETGLHYNTHRYYDAQAHRYLTPDPLGLAVGPDLYAFALNRPHSMQDPLGLAPTPGKDWSKASYEDKLKEIIERAAPKLPGEIGDALLELVQPANLATMGAIFALWAGAQFTPVGWVADLALLGMGIWYAGSGVLDLYKVFSALHADTKAAKCDSDIDAAASKLAKGFVTASGELAGGLSGTWGIAKSGGLTRIAKGIRTVVDFGKRQLKKLAPPPSAAITRPGTAGAKYGPDSKYKTPDGKWNYPPDNGFTGTKTKGTLPKDTVLDRYGNEGGSFLSPQGTPFEMRALPPSSVSDIYNVYKIKKPLPVEAGKIAPAFDQPGGGTQYLLDWAKIAADNGTTIDIIRSYSSPTGKGGIAWLAEVGGYFERLTPPGGIPP
ncbi:MAG TPA: glycohydrolase toxin TNT-related protein, partial [Burkholderiaceae bacterium]|nr:glycohydrolase toxin TNT-related protein [Burkholderiaceae bacterium]